VTFKENDAQKQTCTPGSREIKELSRGGLNHETIKAAPGPDGGGVSIQFGASFLSWLLGSGTSAAKADFSISFTAGLKACSTPWGNESNLCSEAQEERRAEQGMGQPRWWMRNRKDWQGWATRLKPADNQNDSSGIPLGHDRRPVIFSSSRARQQSLDVRLASCRNVFHYPHFQFQHLFN